MLLLVVGGTISVFGCPHKVSQYDIKAAGPITTFDYGHFADIIHTDVSHSPRETNHLLE